MNVVGLKNDYLKIKRITGDSDMSIYDSEASNCMEELPS